MMILPSLFIRTLLLISFFAITLAAEKVGEPHSTVVKLNESNFDDHLNDPANGLWLLKFYAPWYVSRKMKLLS